MTRLFRRYAALCAAVFLVAMALERSSAFYAGASLPSIG
jgi:hypothetical protein